MMGEAMTLDEVMRQLQASSDATTKRTLLRHGAVEPLFGVRVGDLKPLQKKLRVQQSLALELYATRNSDAMYLAGLIADGRQMTVQELDRWAATATWHMIAGYCVPWVASEHPEGLSMAVRWIDSPKELVAVAGWSTLSALASMLSDDRLPIERLSQLLDRCCQDVHRAPNRVRYSINHYVIACGTYILPLAEKAIEAARTMGTVEVDMGDTACKVPDAEPTILKSRGGQPVAPKRKKVRC